MNDYKEQLRIFTDPENRSQTESYFEKYWLSNSEYIEKWLPLQNIIFDDKSKQMPDMMFRSDFEILPLEGGLMFYKENIKLWRDCCKETGDKYFVIIQNPNVQPEIMMPNDETLIHPLLRFKYPSNITLEELMSGGYISTELFQWFYKDYFVFGDSGSWGRYIANDTGNCPFDIIGFKKEYSQIFKKKFGRIPKRELKELEKWLPDSYKKYL